MDKRTGENERINTGLLENQLLFELLLIYGRDSAVSHYRHQGGYVLTMVTLVVPPLWKDGSWAKKELSTHRDLEFLHFDQHMLVFCNRT